MTARECSLSKYTWNEELIRDMVQHWVPIPIQEVIIMILGKVILFFNNRSEHRGLGFEKAEEIIDGLPDTASWAGHTVVVSG